MNINFKLFGIFNLFKKHWIKRNLILILYKLNPDKSQQYQISFLALHFKLIRPYLILYSSKLEFLLQPVTSILVHYLQPRPEPIRVAPLSDSTLKLEVARKY
jgi:hypothetical protein